MVDPRVRTERLVQAWRSACRVAAVSATLAAVLAVVLWSALGVPGPVLVAATALVGAAIGTRLPAASPRWLSR